MTDVSQQVAGAAGAMDIAAPRDPKLVALLRYWQAKSAGRAMPARAEIDPAEIKPLLPNVILYDVLGLGAYRIRLVGEAIVEFLGHNSTGHDATAGMPPDAADTMRRILDSVVQSGTPRFRVGKAYWWREKSYCDFEACFLPLSPDGRSVNIVLGGITFAL